MRVVFLVVLTACGGNNGGDSAQPATPPFASVVVDAQPGAVLLSAWSSGDDMIMVGGDLSSGTGTIVHWAGGQSLCEEPDVLDRALWWIHGRSPDDWYAVGEKGAIVHNIGGIRIREDVPTDATLFGVYDDGVDVWAVGGNVFGDGSGEVWRKVGIAWSLQATTPGLLFKVWNSWVVGHDYAAEWDGEKLVEVPLPDAEHVLTIRGASHDDAWAVGGVTSPQLLHRAASTWSTEAIEPVCGSRELMGIWTAEGEDIYISGASGTAAQYDGTAWSCDDFPISSDAFHAVWKHKDDVFWVGGNLGSSGANHYTIARKGDHKPMIVSTCDQ